MFHSLRTNLYYCVICCVLLRLSIATRDFEKDRPLESVLNDIFESYDSKEPSHQSRRQLDLGPENPDSSTDSYSYEVNETPHHIEGESWTGRWFPDDVTQPPNHSTSETDRESWTGRWFPDDVTQPPHHITSEINPDSSTDSYSYEVNETPHHIEGESWTGRWFPDDVTQPPNHSTSETDRESWTGRWFPDDVTQPPHHITSEINPDSSTDSYSYEVNETPHHIEGESWTGRWFPDDVTQPPNHSTSETDRESWTGRWFPDDVTQPPHHITSEINPDSSTDSYSYEVNETPHHIEGESWTGRWFPDDVTQPPNHSTSETDRESWTGRWFPDDVTQPPHHITSETAPEKWTGKWFPSPTTEIPRRKIILNDLPTENNMWRMINSSCDDGKTNLTVDWPGSPINYTCSNPHQYLLPNYDIPSIIIKSLIPKAYRAKHECMKNEIHYSSDLPTFGTHRPAWPRYGEYQFVPRQRWIHSLEHGAIVMLYHPCAHPQLVSELRELVTRCLFRHIITPYNLLPHDRPLALLSWGWALLMPAPDENGVKSFIRDHGKKGPEVVSRDGQFSEGLTRPAAIISDADDSDLCPQPVLF